MEITAKMVADLRAKTGAGLVDCKRALQDANGDVEEAITILRKKGVASAAKKASRSASEGLIFDYIHLGGKVGVMCEINCESDFVAKTEDFQQLGKDICMHIAAASPIAVTREEVPQDIIAKEREVAAGQVQGKPQNIIDKIVEGKMDKVYAQFCLLEQPFVKNPDISIKDLITEKVAKLGENIVVRRFVRYQMGE